MTRRLLSVTALLLALAVTAPAAHAEFGLVPGSFKAEALDAGGLPELRAGAHPDRLNTGFHLNLTSDDLADGNVKDVVVDLPAGLTGNATAVPTCGRVEVLLFVCPAASQIGVMHTTLIGFGGVIDLPIYNVVPQPDNVAEFNFSLIVIPSWLVASIRSDGDMGTRIELHDIPQNFPLVAGEIELWGVPVDHQSGTPGPRHAFLTNPTRCDQPPTTTLRVRSWEDPGKWLTATSAPAGPLTGCDNLPFNPRFAVSPANAAADSPSGVHIDVTLPQNDDPGGLATSQTRAVSVTLPPGFSLSPGVADGLLACDDQQLGIGTTQAPACPEASKLGTVELTTPLLAKPLQGELYLGSQLPGDTYRLFLAVHGPGFTLKLRGSLRADPQTGQLTTVLSDLPELPFSRFSLTFKDGPRAPLATPPTCGATTAVAQITPFNGAPPVTTDAAVSIFSGPGGAPCPSGSTFAPSFVAGSLPPLGGQSSAFSATIARADGQDTLDRVTLKLPPGLSGRLASVPRCPAMPTTVGGCPAASRIGSVTVDAGAGANPLELVGDVYITGPYRRAPFGLALVVRAIAGPLDLGTIIVPATLTVDPLDASLTVTTDALPTIVTGIPMRLRTVGIDIDRPGFMVNPTSCRVGKVEATIRSVFADASQPSSRFAVGGCRDLGFAPTMSLALSDRGELKRGGHPGLTIKLRARSGQANLRSAKVELPPGMELNTVAVSALCSRTQARDGKCPRGSRIGTATATTPLLSKQLTGDVNVVQPEGNGQPDLWMTMNGDGVRLSLRSTTATPRGKPIRSEFVNLPDVPLSAFTMQLRSGDHGLLTVRRSLCLHGKPRRIQVGATLRGQNDKQRSQRIHVRSRPSCKR